MAELTRYRPYILDYGVTNELRKVSHVMAKDGSCVRYSDAAALAEWNEKMRDALKEILTLADEGDLTNQTLWGIALKAGVALDAPTNECTCSTNQMGPDYCEVHAS